MPKDEFLKWLESQMGEDFENAEVYQRIIDRYEGQPDPVVSFVGEWVPYNVTIAFKPPWYDNPSEFLNALNVISESNFTHFKVFVIGA